MYETPYRNYSALSFNTYTYMESIYYLRVYQENYLFVKRS